MSTPAVLVAAGESTTIPEQPVLGGTGGDPWISVQFYNAQGSLTPEILLGRCVQGLTIDQIVLNAEVVSAMVTATDCSNNPGPWITLEGDITPGDLSARIIFKNNAKAVHTNVQTVDVELLAAGTKVVIPKQPSRGGSGGNPFSRWRRVPDLHSAVPGALQPTVTGRQAPAPRSQLTAGAPVGTDCKHSASTALAHLG